MDMGAEQGQNRMKLVRCAVFFYIYIWTSAGAMGQLMKPETGERCAKLNGSKQIKGWLARCEVGL